MRSYFSAAWKKAGRIWSLSAALLLVTMVAWMSSAVAAPASGGPLGMQAAMSLSSHGVHHMAPDDCCGDVETADCEACVLASACSFCVPLGVVLLDCGLPASEHVAPESPRHPVGLTVLPPDHPPRFPSTV